MKRVRHRNLFLYGGVVVALAASLYTDPDHGLSTLLGGLAIAQGVWAVGAAHWARKALFDYPEADLQRLLARAGETPSGSGMALIALAIVIVGLLMVFSPRAHAGEYMPVGAIEYAPMLKAEQLKFWKDHPQPEVLAGLVEQESCISLKSKGCWNPKTKLRSDREEGGGMGQITRAYRSDGSVRFDSLTDMKNRYKDALGEWTWENLYSRPDLQLRAIVLLSKENSNVFRGATANLEFADAAYNGGAGGVQKERRACVLSSGCNAGLWFDHVENHCLKSRQPLYGGRNACDINREHVFNVFKVRSAKYKALMS